MGLFDDVYVDGFIIGYCVSNLSCLGNLYFEKIIDFEKVKEKYPNITKEILEEASELVYTDNDKDDAYKNFFDKYEDLFRSSKVYNESKEHAYNSLERKEREKNFNVLAISLDEVNKNIIQQEDSNIIFAIRYAFPSVHSVNINRFNLRERQDLAKRFLELENKTAREILDIIKNKQDKEKITFRNNNAVLEICDINDYVIYQICKINTKKPWRINYNMYTSREELYFLKTDEHNQIIDVNI